MPLLLFPSRDPFVIAPLEAIEIKHHGSGLDSVLAVESERIAFQDDLTKTVSHFELVMGSFGHARDKNFPDSGFDPFSHRVASTVPAVEIADNANSLGVGRPDRKACPGMPVDFGEMSTELFVNIVVIALLVEVHVKLT